MILTDESGHLVSDTSLDELHRFARRLGLKREWFQGPPNHSVPHYDLMSAIVRKRALNLGAILTSNRQLVKSAVRDVKSRNRPPPHL